MFEDDLIDFERDLTTLYEPFPSYVKLIKSEFTPEQQLQQIETSGRFAEYDDVQVKAVPIKPSPLNEHDIYAISRIIVLVTICLALFVMFMKSQYIDIMLGIVFYYLYT